jgi:hypothetical protein
VLRFIQIIILLFLLSSVSKAQMPLPKYVLLEKGTYQVPLEAYTFSYTASSKINPQQFITDKWKTFTELKRRTFVAEASYNFTYLAIGFQNKESNYRKFVCNIKQSVLPYLKFYWINTNKDSIYELKQRNYMRTTVVDIPKLNKLYSGVLLIELQTQSSRCTSPVFLFEQNSYYDQELIILFSYSILFGILILQLILIIYSVYLSRNITNVFYVLMILSVAALMIIYNGFLIPFVSPNLKFPPYLVTFFTLSINVFFMIFLYRSAKEDLPKWLAKSTLIIIGIGIVILLLIFVNSTLSLKLSIYVITINAFLTFLILVIACKKSFYKYVYFLIGASLSFFFYLLWVALNFDWVSINTFAFYGIDIGLSSLTLFLTLGLIRNVFSERLKGERLIKQNQMALIEVENELNAKIEEENKLLLAETDDYYRQLNVVKQQIQTRKQVALRKEETLNEIENVIRNADNLIEDIRLSPITYLNLASEQILIINNVNGQVEFVNETINNYFAALDIALNKGESIFSIFSETDSKQLKDILARVFNGYYYSTVLHQPRFKNNNQSAFNYEFVPVKRSNGKVVMALCYAVEA